MSAGLAQVLRTFGPAYLREHAPTSLQAQVWRDVVAWPAPRRWAAGCSSATGWVAPKRSPTFLFPVHALSKVFKGKFIAALQEARGSGRLPRDPATPAQRCPHCKTGRWFTVLTLPKVDEAAGAGAVGGMPQADRIGCRGPP